MLTFLTLLFLLLLFLILIRKRKPVIISHWHHLVQGLRVSVEDFYEEVDGLIDVRKIPDVKVWVEHFHEGGIASAKRMYLLISRREYVFHVCAAPFGKDFFVSWWLGEIPSSVISNIPLLGPLLITMFRPETFYRIDTALMFQDSVHSAVVEVLDQKMKGQGLRLLSESERKPIMRELFRKKM